MKAELTYFTYLLTYRYLLACNSGLSRLQCARACQSRPRTGSAGAAAVEVRHPNWHVSWEEFTSIPGGPRANHGVSGDGFTMFYGSLGSLPYFFPSSSSPAERESM